MMNDYIRSSLLVLNTTYPGYSFEIEEFGGCVLLWCRHQVRNENDEIDTIIMKTRIMNVDLSHEKIVKEGKRLMNEINKEKFNKSYYGICARNSGMSNKYYIAPKEVIFQDERTTIINWTDGTKTIVKCSDDDVFSPEAGIALCYMKKFVTDNDSKRFHRILKNLISVSKFKNSKQKDESSLSDCAKVITSSLFDCAEVIKGVINKLYTEEKHDNDVVSGAPDGAGNNDPDGSVVEVE